MNVSGMMEKFLEFENGSEVLDYRYQYHNMLIWPFIRSVIWNAIMESNEGEGSGLIDNAIQNMRRVKILSYRWLQLFRLKKNPLLCRKKKDIIFMYSATGSIKDDEGRYYNRVHDDFVALYDNTAIIESAPLFRHFYPKKYPAYESDSLDIICLFNEKLTRLSRADEAEINAFIDYLKAELPYEINEKYWRTIRVELERYAKNNKLIYWYYKKCFEHMSPRLVVVTQGCDGNHAACKIKVLKDMGIPCVEIQHGFVGLSHRAYNFSDKIYQSEEYKTYMPDVFLTMGKYWMDCIRIPIKKAVLGNANFCINKEKIKNNQQPQGILVLPTPDIQPWRDLVIYMGQCLPDKEIVIKVHPFYPKQYDYFKEIDMPNVRIGIEGNIYDYLQHAEVVIGDNSTVLYEAAALGRLVMIWNNNSARAYMDLRLGNWFNDAQELVALLRGQALNKEKSMVEPEDIFAYDIKANYLNFIKNYIYRGNELFHVEICAR